MATEKVTLVICDGMGLSADTTGNAVYQAPTPNLDYLLSNYPAVRLLAAGTEVGLDMGEPGNSEVGHITLGTGQVLPQAFQIINGAIKSENYKTNKVFLAAMDKVKRTAGATLHIAGLISAGGVHGHIDHMLALLKLAKERGVERVAIHAMTDGRDSAPRMAAEDLKKLQYALAEFKFGVVATIGGRFYAMDRDNNWERTDVFFWSMMGQANFTAQRSDAAVQAGYERGEGDENLQPTLIVDSFGLPLAPIKTNDSVIFTNYRPDRIRQLATRIIMCNEVLSVVTMTDYFLGDVPTANQQGTIVLTAYPLPKPENSLAVVLARERLTQLHIAESEKYAHITYFFNGHEEQKQALEEWLLVSSLKVTSFKQAPEMSASTITAAYLNSKANHPADFTTINYANMDMVGHTGDFQATMRAVTVVDGQLKSLFEYAERYQEWLLITADHGNAEQMISPITKGVDTEHTTNPVPLILVHPSLKRPRTNDKHQLAVMSNIGILADVAPTILEIMRLRKPPEMVGTSLLTQLLSL